MTIVTKSDRRCQPPSDAEVREVTLTEPPGPTDTPATDLSAAEGLSRNNNPDWVRDLARSPYGKALARRAERAAVAARPSLAELRIQLAQEAGNPEGPGGGVRLVEPRLIGRSPEGRNSKRNQNFQMTILQIHRLPVLEVDFSL